MIHVTLGRCHVSYASNLTVGADGDMVNDIDALGSNWEPPDEVEELLPGSHITVQACEHAPNSSTPCHETVLCSSC